MLSSIPSLNQKPVDNVSFPVESSPSSPGFIKSVRNSISNMISSKKQYQI